MQIKLSDHFTYGRLLRYTLPTIVMIIFTSLYSVVDGLFVSNLVGDLALSAVNIAFPITMIIGAFGFMLGTGGSAIVARTLGEGKPELASRYFTLFIWCVAGLGVVLSIVTIAFIEPIMRFAGASDLLLEDCIAYGRILLAGSAVFMLQSAFQSFFSVAEKPKLGLLLSLAAGATNITFDYVFIALLGMGVTGAAWATVLGYCVGGVIPVVYFLLPRREGLRLVRTNFYGRELLLGADEQHLRLRGGHPLQHPADGPSGRAGRGGPLGDDVRGFRVCGCLSGVLHGQRPHRQLSLRGGEL